MTEAALVAEQIAHIRDNLVHQITVLDGKLTHHTEIDDNAHAALLQRLADLESERNDHETRLRELTTTATQFKLLASLSTGGGLLSVILLIRTLLAP